MPFSFKKFKKDKDLTAGRMAGLVVLIALYLTAGPGYQWALYNTHWFHHDKLMFVEAENWVNGEYKTCVTLNVDLEEPSLTCDPNARGKLFKVQFDAETYDKEKPDTTSVRWKCRKNGDNEVAIDCEYISNVR